LSKDELSVKDVRDLIGIPLRGELSRSSGTLLQQPSSAEQNSDSIQQIVSQFVRLAQSPSVLPQITVSSDVVDSDAQNAAAPWSWTATEAATTEAVLFPFLIHLAAAKDDLESLNFCLKPVNRGDELLRFKMIPGGIVNCLESSSGRSPLHVACLNGNIRSVELLLRSGALVHLRDNLGHTALYFVSRSLRVVRSEVNCIRIHQAARQGHEAIVDVLVQAGAALGGTDQLFVNTIVKEATRAGNLHSVCIWLKAGWKSGLEVNV
jgi:60kDa lysophospholipase